MRLSEQPFNTPFYAPDSMGSNPASSPGERPSSPEFLQPHGTVLNVRKLWEQSVQRHDYLIERLNTADTPLNPLRIQKLERDLQIVQTTIAVAQEFKQQGRSLKANDIFQEVSNLLQNIQQTNDSLLHIAFDFFITNHLPERILYDRTFVQMLGDKKFEKIVDERIARSEEVPYIRPDPEGFYGKVASLIDQGITDRVLMDAILGHDFSKGSISQNLFVMSRALFPEYSKEDWENLRSQDITAATIWERMTDEVKMRIHAAPYHLTDVQRQLLTTVTSIARGHEEMMSKTVLEQAANRVGRSVTSVTNELHADIKHKLFSTEELKSAGVELSLWDLMADANPAVYEALDEGTNSIKARHDQSAMVEALLNRSEEFTTFDAAVQSIAHQFSMDLNKAYALIAQGLLSLYPPKERGTFFSQIEDSTYELIDTFCKNEGVLTLTVYMALNPSMKQTAAGWSRTLSMLQMRSGELEANTPDTLSLESDIYQQAISKIWFPKLVEQGIILREESGFPEFSINPAMQELILRTGIPLLSLITEQSLSLRDFLGRIPRERISTLAEITRVLSDTQQRVTVTDMARGTGIDPAILGRYLPVLSDANFLTYRSSLEPKHVLVDKAMPFEKVHIPPHLQEHREAVEEIYRLFQQSNKPLSIRDIYMSSPAFYLLPYEQVKPVISSILKDWESKERKYLTISEEAFDKGKRSAITQSLDQRTTALRFFNILCDMQDNNTGEDPLQIISRAYELYRDPVTMRNLLSHTFKERRLQPQLADEVLDYIFDQPQPIPMADFASHFRLTPPRLYHLLEDLIDEGRVTVASEKPVRTWELPMAEQLYQIARRIMKKGVITSKGTVVLYGDAAEKFIRERQLEDILRVNPITQLRRTRDALSGESETILFISGLTRLNPDPQGLNADAAFLNALRHLQHHAAENPDFIRHIKESNKES